MKDSFPEKFYVISSKILVVFSLFHIRLTFGLTNFSHEQIVNGYCRNFQCFTGFQRGHKLGKHGKFRELFDFFFAEKNLEKSGKM